jgi:hypothetical protein
MSKDKQIQDYASPTEASKDKKEWDDSAYQSVKSGKDEPYTRQDADKRDKDSGTGDGSSHIHYGFRSIEDNKTMVPDSDGKTSIAQKVVWPDENED